ncbi:glycosyltransferase [Streptococcus sp. sy004]|uniref:glycosyltransferase family 2 protein n=1 Tax=Streptococcus sp. sy004 TaxID=2600149 RepID=UPI0011B808FC|nr:glycosyltransferase [Streptococcus sp. sy004]TWT11035.1 glycosyltransferase [Streptococcus sp. sy004]
MISVVIPCYNCEETVSSCLDSLLNQTYQDFEIICVNDGSKDDTLDVLKTYQKQHPQLKLTIVSHHNQGVSFTRNRGMELAQGTYVSFVDPDDLVDTRFLELLYQPYLIEDCQLSVVGVQKTNEESINLDGGLEFLSKEQYFHKIFRDPMVKGYSCNKLYRLDLIKQQQIFFKSDLTVMEDLEFNVHYCSFVKKVAYTKEQLYHYVIHPKSVMNKGWQDDKMSVLKTFSYMRQYPMSKEQQELIALDYTRSLLWLIGQLYRTGSNQDIVQWEPKLLEELSREQGLFLRRGYQVGLKYYLSYLFFSLNKRLLRLVIR